MLDRMVDRLTGSGDFAQTATGFAATQWGEAHHHLGLRLAGMGADGGTRSVIVVVQGGDFVAGGMLDMDANRFGADRYRNHHGSWCGSRNRLLRLGRSGQGDLDGFHRAADWAWAAPLRRP